MRNLAPRLIACAPILLATAATAQELEKIDLRIGRSSQLELGWAFQGVSVTDPTVADVEPIGPNRLLVSGKSRGRTDVILWGEDGETATYEVHVGSDLSGISGDMELLFPGASLEVRESQDTLVVTGALARLDQALQVHAYFDSLDVPWVDMTSLPGVQQVQVQVRVAEVSRNYFRTLGVNGIGVGEDVFVGSTLGSSAGGPINPINLGIPENALGSTNLPFTFNSDTNVSPGVTLFAGFPAADLELFFQALAENQFMRVLAEPTLVALSGEEASFLAGGEFPIPVVQGSTGSGGNSSITIEYKEFGVQLKFRPEVLGDGGIRLDVMAELSELSDLGAVEIQGFRIPSVLTRRTETSLEMHSGQTFAMSGLISEETSAQVSKTPVLGDLPVLGTMFRSVRYRTGETELLVLVTASLVEPLSSTVLPPLPGTTHEAPSDWDLFIRGKTEADVPARLAPEDSEWLRQLGLDELRGPGAWATHDGR